MLFSLLGGIVLIITLSYTYIYLHVAEALQSQDDANLISKIEGFALMGEIEIEEDEEEDDEPYNDFGDDPDNAIEFEFAEIPMPEYQALPNAEYYQVWDATGLTLARSPSLNGANLPRSTPEGEGVHLEDILLPDSRRGRLATTFLYPKVDGPAADTETVQLVFSIARSTEELGTTLAVLSMGLLLTGLATLVIVSILILYTVRRGLSPLDAMRTEIASLGSDDLDYRFALEQKPEELLAVCTCLNDLLARLGKAFDRERRFTSDVAHELRTPVAELRALAEVSMKRDHTSDSDKRSFQDVCEITQHMEDVISALLDIARCASGQVAKEQKRLNINSVVKTAWQPFVEAADSKKLTVDLGLNGCREFDSDPVLLDTILTNLFSNAVAYTPRGGNVQLALKEEEPFLLMKLSNTTDSLTKGDLTHLFDTFWRKDTALDDGAHAGIGLSLVAALAGVLEVDVETGMPSDDTFQITLRHPI
jgi:two-component system sensor histidine kinase QseC